jgi:hypothetical protein
MGYKNIMFREKRVVDNRVFLLGLDELYRELMKRHEREELLHCARRVTEVLHEPAASVPIEGYFTEDHFLTEYFCLLRALQDVPKDRTHEVVSLPEFQRLHNVTSSPIYGRAQEGKLLPLGRDHLSQALIDTRQDWNIQKLITAAYTSAIQTDDISLVGLAARAKDAVVLAATRESVVLYAEMEFAAALGQREPKYIWKVDKNLAEQGRRFIDTFNSLFSEKLPPPESTQAETYWNAYKNNKILGRCVRLGYDDRQRPPLQYHWAICLLDDGALTLQDFWHAEVWTTQRYRSVLPYDGKCPKL